MKSYEPPEQIRMVVGLGTGFGANQDVPGYTLQLKRMAQKFYFICDIQIFLKKAYSSISYKFMVSLKFKRKGPSLLFCAPSGAGCHLEGDCWLLL